MVSRLFNRKVFFNVAQRFFVNKVRFLVRGFSGGKSGAYKQLLFFDEVLKVVFFLNIVTLVATNSSD